MKKLVYLIIGGLLVGMGTLQAQKHLKLDLMRTIEMANDLSGTKYVSVRILGISDL